MIINNDVIRQIPINLKNHFILLSVFDFGGAKLLRKKHATKNRSVHCTNTSVYCMK